MLLRSADDCRRYLIGLRSPGGRTLPAACSHKFIQRRADRWRIVRIWIRPVEQRRARLLYRHQPERALLIAMPVILLGLVLALDVLGAASGLGAAGQWREIGAGVGYALAASATFGLALVLTQHEAGGLDGRLRTAQIERRRRPQYRQRRAHAKKPRRLPRTSKN